MAYDPNRAAYGYNEYGGGTGSDQDTGEDENDPERQARLKAEADERARQEEAARQQGGGGFLGKVWDGVKWVASQTPLGQAVQAGQQVAKGDDVTGWIGYTPVGEAAESVGQAAHGKEITGPGGWTPAGAAYNLARKGVNWARDNLGGPGAGPMGPEGGYGESGLPVPGSLTDLRDRFLSERGAVSSYAPERVVGGPAGPVGLERTDINQARGMTLDHIRGLQDVASGRVPSVADAQRRAALLDSTQSAFGLAAAAAPSQGSGGLRAALRATAEGGRRSGFDASLIAAKEQADARAQIGGQIEGMRSAEQNLALAEAKRLQDLGISDADRALRAGETNSKLGLDAYRTMVDERAGLGKLGLDAESTASTTRLNEARIQDMRNQLAFLYKKLETETDNTRRQQTMALIGSIVGALGGVGAAAAGGA